MLCPGFVAIGILWMPESPRWLIGKDRADQARAIITQYHANGEGGHPIVELQMAEMTDSLRQEGMTNWRDFFDLRVLVKSRARRYRLMLNIAFSWFGQFSGNNVSSYYLPYLLQNVGVTNTNTKLILNIVSAVLLDRPPHTLLSLIYVAITEKCLWISTRPPSSPDSTSLNLVRSYG